VITLDGDLSTTTWTTVQAAAAAGVQPGRIRIWAHRGKLTPVNPRSARPRYRALDVLRVEAEMRHHTPKAAAA
jgi:predicted site-specific integrase-resolvase